MVRGNRIDLKKILLQEYPFLFAFIIMVIHVFPLESMALRSYDASEIWKTIQTYGTEDVYGTYVLYKGLGAVYPYLWFYRLALLVGLNEWFFIKLFYCVAFSYVSAIGFPKMIELLVDEVVKPYRKIILVILCFFFWSSTLALSEFMVDLPSMFYFVLLVNCGLKIYKGEPTIWNYVWYGILFGLNLCASGQYTMPAYCITVLVVIVSIKRSRITIKKTVEMLGRFATMFIIAFSFNGANSYYIDTFVGGLREKGAWIPDGMAWLSMGFSRFMTVYRAGSGYGIPSTRNAAIYQDLLGAEQFEQMFNMILGGGYPLSIQQYFELFFKYPFDFILCFLEKFFIILSPDGGSFQFVPLFIFYSLAFVALYIGFSKCKKFKNIFNVKFWVGFSFLWAIVPLLIGAVEARCCMQIQGLILALAVCSDFIWERGKNFYIGIREGIRNKEYKNFGEVTIPYSIIIYILFIVLCFLNMSTLYELIGIDASRVLINF